MADKSISPGKWENVKSLIQSTGTREDGKISKILMAIDEAIKSYSAGQLQHDPITKMPLYDTGYAGVRINIGGKIFIPFFNNTGVEIGNGKPINAFGVNVPNKVFNGILADASDPLKSSAVIGFSTHAVPDQTVGLATELGQVNDVDTDGLAVGGILYLGITPGAITNTRPRYPSNILVMGSVLEAHLTTGKIFSKQSIFNRNTGSRSYSFTSSSVGAGVKYLGGTYKFNSTNASLTQASLTQLFGSANIAYSAHASAIFGGAGVVDAGVVGLRVNGTSVEDDGVRTESDSEIITNDITAVSLNEYLETVKNWLGQIEYELFVVSGTPTSYSLDFNYGFSSYEDVSNTDFTIRGFKVEGNAGANDSNFNVELLHHKFTGWTYAASGFVPGNGAIQKDGKDISFTGILGVDSNLSSREPFKLKVTDINQFIDGNGPEGIIIKVTTGSTNSVQFMNAHIDAVSEELV